ncbi:MAG: hypothetical protein LBI31_07335 [Zoogloeaceae bacterium]|jgi:hypothetical protein|nr:hypothetical protein [Zoogloeaceae bacterium]
MRPVSQKENIILICCGVVALAGIGTAVVSLFAGRYNLALFGMFLLVLALIVDSIVTGDRKTVLHIVFSFMIGFFGAKWWGDALVVPFFLIGGIVFPLWLFRQPGKSRNGGCEVDSNANLML